MQKHMCLSHEDEACASHILTIIIDAPIKCNKIWNSLSKLNYTKKNVCIYISNACFKKKGIGHSILFIYLF